MNPTDAIKRFEAMLNEALKTLRLQDRPDAYRETFDTALSHALVLLPERSLEAWADLIDYEVARLTEEAKAA